MRYAMSGGLTGQLLGQALNAFESGDLRQAALIWERQASRDMMIKNVKPKREKAVSRRDWQVLTADDSGTAKAHKQALDAFWNNIRARNAWNRNDKGSFALLVRQMMTAVSYQFAAHHLVWSPSRGELGCTFEFVPLQFFEGRAGELRFCPTGMEPEGIMMPEDEWMVTVGDGLMTAASIGAFAKSDALTNLLLFCESFGVPAVLGRTSAAQDSDAGRSMADAVETIMNDWRAVLYGDDGNGKIELIRAEGGAGSTPMPLVVELVDRALAALWRGADLSSMSSRSGEGSGASLQGEESDILEVDDALMISERLNEIERQVIEWYFGRGVRPKAYIKLLVPQSEDLKLLLQALETLVKLGAPIATNDVLERFGFGQPKAGAALLGQKADAATLDPEQRQAQQRINADANEDAFLRQSARLLAKARKEDRAGLVDELKEVLRTPEESRLVPALNAFIARLPEQIGQDAAQVRAWERCIATALLNGWASNEADLSLA